MTNPKQTLETWELHSQAVKEANALNKSAVFDALTAAGVTLILLDFDGEGDSGQIQNVQAYTAEIQTELPEVTVEFHQTAWNSSKLDASSRKLREALDELCYDYLEQEHGGWENNDGAFGEFTFDVAERHIDLEFNARFSDFTTSSHTF